MTDNPENLCIIGTCRNVQVGEGSYEAVNLIKSNLVQRPNTCAHHVQMSSQDYRKEYLASPRRKP